mmetsp:Transcript_16494/g.19509  ORF Transcript_16494/g.19509 Transcript_16494/m.19509 type:complete len:587 (-) Transcript_16494:17-1777(-)
MGSAALTTPRGPIEGGGLIAGVLNLLGEGFNPFEFLPQQPIFLECYETLLHEWDHLRWEHISPYIDSLSSFSSEVDSCIDQFRIHCEKSEANSDKGSVASYFSEIILKNDNKFLDHRLNLVTFAMRPYKMTQNDNDDEKCFAQWRLLDSNNGQTSLWIKELSLLLQKQNGSYLKDPRLLIWDLCCCVLASRQLDAYTSICVKSHLNPDNENGGEVFFSAAAHAATNVENYKMLNPSGRMPIVLGLLEWPAQARRRDAFLASCKQHNFTVSIGSDESGVAIASSAYLGQPIVLSGDASSVVSPKAIMSSIVDDLEQSSEGGFNKKERDGLIKTTAAKTLASMVCLDSKTGHSSPEAGSNWLICVVIHSKEPKSALMTKALALFVSRMVSAAQEAAPRALLTMHPHLQEGEEVAPSDFSNFVVMSDTNVASHPTAQIFRDELAAHRLEASLDPSVITTRKKRSRLHGQCYDAKKCHVTVTAPKDCIITSTASFVHNSTSDCVFPDINTIDGNGAARTLPDSDWASDHCIVTSMISIKEPIRVTVPSSSASIPSPPVSPGARESRMRSRSWHSGFFDEPNDDDELDDEP